MATQPEFLFRFGVDAETAQELESASEDAVQRGFPHGVSAMSENYRSDACVASRADLELYFSVVKTGRRRIHFTIVLPHPVTPLDAERFNGAFRRESGAGHGRD